MWLCPANTTRGEWKIATDVANASQIQTPDDRRRDFEGGDVRQIHRLSEVEFETDFRHASAAYRSDSMLMKTKPRKRTKVGDNSFSNDVTDADLGGEGMLAGDGSFAPKNTADDRILANVSSDVSRAGEGPCDFESMTARSNQAAGEVGIDAEKSSASEGGDTIAVNDYRGSPHEQLHGGGVDNELPSVQGGDGPKVDTETSVVCRQIQELQRYRVTMLKMRNMIDNALRAAIAQHLGYSTGLEEADRKKMFAEADKFIKAIEAVDEDARGTDTMGVAGLVLDTRISRNGYDARVKAYEKAMAKLAKTLPAVEWVQTVRGFGVGNFAIIIGECGDLTNYANPAKVWKRLGLAPYQGQMPSTWRSKGGLTAEQWTEIGYSPRRRSAMYVLSECIVKLNKGEYRERYDTVKVSAAEKHPDWPKGRCHNHAMLLTVKRLVRDLWCKWHGAEAT